MRERWEREAASRPDSSAKKANVWAELKPWVLRAASLPTQSHRTRLNGAPTIMRTPRSSAKKGESLGRAEDWSKSLVSNGIQLCLMHGVQWSTREPVQTVVETPTYLAIANKLFSEEERADIVALVAADPECGDLIRGTGGFRKARVARKGMGKSGGRGLCISGATKDFRFFSSRFFRRMRKKTCRWQSATR